MDIVNVAELLEAHPEGSFLDLCAFNGSSFGTCAVTGVSPGWEMHPDTDEFFYVLEGTVELTLLLDDGPQHHIAPAGSAFVVPRGIWHKPGAPDGARFIFHTPGQSLYSEKEDPRIEEGGQRLKNMESSRDAISAITVLATLIYSNTAT